MSQSGSQAVCRVSPSQPDCQSVFAIRPPVANVRPKSLAIRSAKQSEKAARIEAKIDQKSLPGGARGTQIDPKSTSGRPGRFRVVPGASRSVPGAPRERPKGAPGEARGAPRSRRGSKKSAQEGPEPPRSMQNRSKVASESGKNAKLSLGRVGMLTRIDFRSIFGRFSKIAFS